MVRRTGRALSGQEGQLWSAYQADRSLANRNALVEFYLPLLGRVASDMARHLRRADTVAGLQSDATAALIRAVETFEPSRGVMFTTHAGLRLRGGILDAIRDRDPVPRAARLHAKRIAAATREWQRTHAKPPTDAQFARRLHISLAVLASWRRDCEMLYICEFSLDAGYADPKTGRHQHQIDFLHDRLSPPPDADQSHLDWWRAVLAGLSPTSQATIVLYWRYEWTLKKIGRHMGLSESRLSQVHSAILRFLKANRKAADFADINSLGRPPKLLRLALPICHSLRRQLHPQ